MLIVLSPAKSLDFDTPIKYKKSSNPALIDDAATLITILKALSADQIGILMKISVGLAELNADRYDNWSLYPIAHRNRQAVLAFNGDVYEGLNAKSLNSGQLDYLQSRLRILSGLYGLLRPLDLIQAYRLEMGSPLVNDYGKNLYAFWGGKITEMLNETMQAQNIKFLINLASEEYFKAVRPALLNFPVITPIFQDYKNGEYKIISFFAKRARGLMARYCAVHKINKPEKLKLFDIDGYAYCQEASDPIRWVFRRRLSE
ncbi:MAG: peroxide stress protein YaaA [Pseudomonadota bacterium]